MELRGRALIEKRFGAVGRGVQCMLIGDAEYDLETLLARMDLLCEDMKGIDMGTVEGHFFVRYYDGQDQRIVVHEFDPDFRFLAESRAHIAEWIGEDNYYEWFRGAGFRCPLVPGEDF
jgi:hypothetical protein